MRKIISLLTALLFIVTLIPFGSVMAADETNPYIEKILGHYECTSSDNEILDDMFLAICKTGGVAGINLYTNFLGENANIDTVCDHILHFLALDPDGKHIALGGDLDGCDSLPAGFAGVQDYQKIAERLMERGVPEQTVMDIFWNNAYEVMRNAVPKHKE